MNIFAGKIAIVTGAGSGIGRGLAEELARRGAYTVVSDIDSARIEQVTTAIAAKSGRVTGLVLDVSDYEAVKKMIDDTVSAHGRIDYIFNNAGVAIGGPAKDFQIEDWCRVIDINLYGVVYGASVAYPIMVRQGCGHIVNTASVEGLAPFPATASYVTSKYGVVGLSHALRIEGEAHGVKVSAVCPGYVRTAIFADSKKIGVDSQYLLGLKDWMGVSPEECAKIILRGVERNRAIIPVTFFAGYLWWLNRFSPGLVMRMMQYEYKKALKKGILS